MLKEISTQVFVTKKISEESEKPLPEWIKIKTPSDRRYQQILEMDLDPGGETNFRFSEDLFQIILKEAEE